MQTITTGAKKKIYPSIKAAYEAAKIVNPELKYITFYMRMRKDTGGLMWSVSKAMKKPVRKYVRSSKMMENTNEAG